MAIASRSRGNRAATDGQRGRGLILWLGIAATCTAVLWVVRDHADKAHMALAYLLVVLVASARHGRVVGLVLSVVCFLAFNFFLLPPFHTFAIAESLDWAVLAAFLVTGMVAAQLLHREQAAARAAELRAREMDRLAALGAESLSVAAADDAVAAIARVIRTELPIREADIRVRPDDATAAAQTDLVAFAAREGRIACVSLDGTSHLEPLSATLSSVLLRASGYAEVVVPLRVSDRTVGVLRLADRPALRVEPAQAAFADALAYYAALAVERVRLTREAQAAEALREADRLKDALLASVSHDLRTPLTSIRATASEMRHEGDARAALIEEEAERLNRMVADLLDLSRLRAGALPLEAAINAAEDLVGAALQRLSGVRGADAIVVRLPADGALPLGRFDFVHSLRALTNLLENALRHSPAPGSVELEVEETTSDLVFRVLDRGPGIAPADVPRLFEPFHRFAERRDGGGSGLGLAIARSIAQAQGGHIAYAPRPGGGSTFELHLPAVRLEHIP